MDTPIVRMLVASAQILTPHMQCKLKGTKIHALEGNLFNCLSKPFTNESTNASCCCA